MNSQEHRCLTPVYSHRNNPGALSGGTSLPPHTHTHPQTKSHIQNLRSAFMMEGGVNNIDSYIVTLCSSHLEVSCDVEWKSWWTMPSAMVWYWFILVWVCGCRVVYSCYGKLMSALDQKITSMCIAAILTTLSNKEPILCNIVFFIMIYKCWSYFWR